MKLPNDYSVPDADADAASIVLLDFHIIVVVR
jgi:hypothetical protein